MDEFLAIIKLFGGNFAIRGWAMCNGQILSIAQNTALFSLLGTTFGGNGQTTFALPDLRGRVPVHPGQGPGLSSYSLGQVGGQETQTLTINEMPAHSHTFSVPAVSSAGNANTPGADKAPALLVDSRNNPINYLSNAAPNTTLRPGNAGISGGSQPHNNIQPYLAINYLICMEGIYPSRN